MALCKKEEIVFQAYASMGVGPFGLMDIKVVKNIACKVGVSEAQVLIRWGLQYDFALLPLSQPRRRG